MPGTIEKRGPNSWRISVSSGTSTAGKRQRVRQTVTFPETMTESQQRRECEKTSATMYTDVQRGNLVCAKQLTVAEFAAEWLDAYPKTAQLSPVTVDGYRNLLEGRVYQTLGHVKLDQLTARHIERFYANLLSEPARNNGAGGKALTASSVLHYHRVLRCMLNTAQRWGRIAVNPMTKVRPPKNDAQRHKVYDPETASTVLEALQEEPLKYQCGISLALLCQLRLGEIGGLDWTDVSFDAGTLTVRQTAVAISGQVLIKPPKTESGRRTISVPVDVMNLLRRLRVEQAEDRMKQGEAWIDSGAVFCQWTGARQYPKTISAWFQDFLKRHDLPAIRFHDLRHTGASLLLNIMDTPMRVVTDRLGHADPGITMRFYSHSFEQRDKAAAQGLGELLTPKKNAK